MTSARNPECTAIGTTTGRIRSRPARMRADGLFIIIVPKATAANSTVNAINTSENPITIPS
jgi:hypothetical protein